MDDLIGIPFVSTLKHARKAGTETALPPHRPDRARTVIWANTKMSQETGPLFATPVRNTRILLPQVAPPWMNAFVQWDGKKYGRATVLPLSAATWMNALPPS